MKSYLDSTWAGKGTFAGMCNQEVGGLQQRDRSSYHQEFQVPKMEGFLNLIFGYFGGGFSLT